MSYVQPLEGRSFKWGVIHSKRDTKKEPLSPDTLKGYYRFHDEAFDRSQNLLGVQTRDGFRQLYAERVKWKFTIPFVGSLVSRFI